MQAAIEGASHATQDPLINWIFSGLTSIILALVGAIVYLYKTKVAQDKEHKDEMKELYGTMNALANKVAETLAITNERLNKRR